MLNQWRQTPNGEWVRDGVGVVIGIQDRLWFAYVDADRLGPFRSCEAAASAAEQQQDQPEPS